MGEAPDICGAVLFSPGGSVLVDGLVPVLNAVAVGRVAASVVQLLLRRIDDESSLPLKCVLSFRSIRLCVRVEKNFMAAVALARGPDCWGHAEVR